MGEAPEAWGRVAEDGTVYVRTADGERQVGSWAAGSPDEALAYYQRKFDGLKVEVDLIANRLKQSGPAAPSPKDALEKIGKLREQISGAAAVGDLDGLLARLDGLVELAEQRRAEHRAAREQQQADARAAKQALAEEAERLAASTDWRVAGDRMKVLLDEWKAAPRLDRKTDDELWHRLSQSRSAFTKRRKQHFAELDQAGADPREKERLIAEAETLLDHRLGPHLRPLPRTHARVEGRRTGPARGRRQALGPLPRRPGHLLRRPGRHPGRGERRAVQNQAAKEALLVEIEAILPVKDAKPPATSSATARALGRDRQGAARLHARDRRPAAHRRPRGEDAEAAERPARTRRSGPAPRPPSSSCGPPSRSCAARLRRRARPARRRRPPTPRTPSRPGRNGWRRLRRRWRSSRAEGVHALKPAGPAWPLRPPVRAGVPWRCRTRPSAINT